MLKKKCASCKTDKDPSEFNKNKNKKDGLSIECRSCSNARGKKHYQKNRERYIARAMAGRPSLKGKCYDYVKSLNPKCQHCGEDDIRCIDWHHVDPTTKVATISRLMQTGEFQKLLLEIPKCIPLCANCHRKHHIKQ
jgi:hypothetical protein